MTTDMLEAPTSAASAHPYGADQAAERPPQSAEGVAIPERLLEELSDIIADALVASIERDRAGITAHC
jgi:hypothetical protein